MRRQKLSQSTQARLAQLINAVAVWNDVMGSAQECGENELAATAHDAYKQAGLALYDEFGIVLPCTERWLAARKAAVERSVAKLSEQAARHETIRVECERPVPYGG